MTLRILLVGLLGLAACEGGSPYSSTIGGAGGNPDASSNQGGGGGGGNGNPGGNPGSSEFPDPNKPCAPSCGANQACIGGACLPTGGSCQTACDCPQGLACMGGTCKLSNRLSDYMDRAKYPEYCCDKPGPPGVICEKRDGTSATFGGLNCVTTCDCPDGYQCGVGGCYRNDPDYPYTAGKYKACCGSAQCKGSAECVTPDGSGGTCDGKRWTVGDKCGCSTDEDPTGTQCTVKNVCPNNCLIVSHHQGYIERQYCETMPPNPCAGGNACPHGGQVNAGLFIETTCYRQLEAPVYCPLGGQ